MSERPPELSYFRSPATVIGRFVARRTVRGAAFWALVFGGFLASKGIGLVEAYPTLASRAKLAVSFGSNIGFKALLGAPHHVAQAPAFAAWNTAGGMVIIGSIWAFLLASKTFRGEEDNGRWETLLAGQTTARRAAINVLAGLGATLLVFYVVLAATFTAIGQYHKLAFSPASALFFALVIVLVVALFMMVGALASQLMPTRGRAAGAAAAVFGLCFVVRAMADTTSASWLLNLTPLGWAEKAQPLAESRPIWIVPLIALITLLAGLTIYLAGRRDLGASTFADKDSAPPHTALLNTPLEVALRLTRASTIGWLFGIGLLTLFFGLLTRSAAQAFSASAGAQKEISHLTHSSQAFGATTFLSIVFFIAMTILMAYADSALGAIREEEANGRLDNLLVRPVSRLHWLGGRLLLVTAASGLAGILISLTVWLGIASQNDSVGFHTVWLAGINAVTPAILIIGLGTFAFGIIPRLTTLVAYSLIAWSFLLDIVSSGINLNHWILDTSIFQHVVLAPAADPNWSRNATVTAIGVVLAGIGGLWFNHRDLQAE